MTGLTRPTHAVRRFFALVAVMGLSFTSGPSAAQPTADRLSEMLVGNYTFFLFHELGHAMINELDLPIVGVEEDVVDEFAAVALVSLARSEELPQEQQIALNQVVVDAAIGFAALWKLKQANVGGDLSKLPFWDEHGLDIKRFYNIICVFVGSDPERFAPIGREAGMPDERIQRCVEDFSRKETAWERVLEPYARGDAPPAENERVRVFYGQATTPFSQQLEQDLKARQLLESVAELFETNFVLPRGLKLTAGECGEPNAFYNPQEGSITMCHELVALMRELFTGGAQPQPQPAPMPQPQPGPTPQQPGPYPQPGPQTQPYPQPAPYPQPVPHPHPAPYPQPAPVPQPAALETYLIGSWAGGYVDQTTGAQIQAQLVISPGRRFEQLSYNPWTGFALRIWGTFEIYGNSIRTQVQGYDPRQFCGPSGHCTPITIPMAETVPIQVIDQYQMMAGPAYLQRMR